MTPQDPTRLLRLALRANAAFSTASGLVFALAGSAVAGFLGGVATAEVVGVGVQLLLFAAALVWLSTRASIPPPLVVAVIVADLAWVLGTIVVVYAQVLSREGAIAAIAVANVVLLFAVLQWLGLRRARRPAWS